jgi:hypothetical protein
VNRRPVNSKRPKKHLANQYSSSVRDSRPPFTNHHAHTNTHPCLIAKYPSLCLGPQSHRKYPVSASPPTPSSSRNLSPIQSHTNPPHLSPRRCTNSIGHPHPSAGRAHMCKRRSRSGPELELEARICGGENGEAKRGWKPGWGRCFRVSERARSERRGRGGFVCGVWRRDVRYRFAGCR